MPFLTKERHTTFLNVFLMFVHISPLFQRAATFFCFCRSCLKPYLPQNAIHAQFVINYSFCSTSSLFCCQGLSCPFTIVLAMSLWIGFYVVLLDCPAHGVATLHAHCKHCKAVAGPGPEAPGMLQLLPRMPSHPIASEG